MFGRTEPLHSLLSGLALRVDLNLRRVELEEVMDGQLARLVSVEQSRRNEFVHALWSAHPLPHSLCRHAPIELRPR